MEISYQATGDFSGAGQQTFSVPQFSGDNLLGVSILVSWSASVDYLLNNGGTRDIRYGRIAQQIGYDLACDQESITSDFEVGQGIIPVGDTKKFSFAESYNSFFAISKDLERFRGEGMAQFSITFDPWVNVSLSGATLGVGQEIIASANVTLRVTYEY